MKQRKQQEAKKYVLPATTLVLSWSLFAFFVSLCRCIVAIWDQEQLCKKLSDMGLEYKIVLRDCVHVVDMFPATGKLKCPTVEEINGECKWISPDMIRNRANQSLSREKCYLVQRNTGGMVPFYGTIGFWSTCEWGCVLLTGMSCDAGHYVGSSAGHVLSEDIDALSKPVTTRLFELLNRLQPINHVICTKYRDRSMYMPGTSSLCASAAASEPWCMLFICVCVTYLPVPFCYLACMAVGSSFRQDSRLGRSVLDSGLVVWRDSTIGVYEYIRREACLYS